MASNILSTNITIEDGIIYVQSTDDKEKKHNVVFDAGGMPYCDCFNWRENLLPCKHMFAVIIHCKEYSWESLPEQYRNSSYFTLDPSCSLQKNSILKEKQKEENSEEDIPDILSGKWWLILFLGEMGGINHYHTNQWQSKTKNIAGVKVQNFPTGGFKPDSWKWVGCIHPYYTPPGFATATNLLKLAH